MAKEPQKKATPFQIDFKSSRGAGVPLVCVQTQDPKSVLAQIYEITQQEDTKDFNAPLLSWDISSGLQTYNKLGQEVLQEMLKTAGTTSEKIVDPVASFKLFKLLLGKGAKLPSGTLKAGAILLVYSAHRLMATKNIVPEAIISQTIWNLRDEFKSNGRTLVLTAPELTLPQELAHDVLVLDEPLPTQIELREKVSLLYEAAELKTPDEITLVKAGEAGRGLSLFAAEQAYAMSLTKEKNGLDFEKLGHRKRKMIEASGLTIWKEKNTYADVVGIERAKEFLTAIFNGNDRPTGVLFIDELEKQLSGVGGDRSGVTDEMHGQFLSWLVDEDVPFMLMYGQPGCSKSYLAKTTGAQFESPCIILSITNAKGGIVGQSTGQFASRLKLISSICRPLLLATSNNVDLLSQELRSRANLGTYFFDLPSPESRLATWKMYIKKFKLHETKTAVIPPDKDWTPREIKDCCALAWKTNWTLKQASQSITPVIVSSPEKIEERRRRASKRFLSADHPGTFEYNDTRYEIDEKQIKEIKNVGNA